MAKYYLTNKAVDDLTKIWNYTFDQLSEQQADKYYQMLIENGQNNQFLPNLNLTVKACYIFALILTPCQEIYRQPWVFLDMT